MWLIIHNLASIFRYDACAVVEYGNSKFLSDTNRWFGQLNRLDLFNSLTYSKIILYYMNLPKNGVAWVVRGIVEKNTCPNYILSVNIALVEDILEKCQLEINVGRIKKNWFLINPRCDSTFIKYWNFYSVFISITPCIYWIISATRDDCNLKRRSELKLNGLKVQKVFIKIEDLDFGKKTNYRSYSWWLATINSLFLNAFK